MYQKLFGGHLILLTTLSDEYLRGELHIHKQLPAGSDYELFSIEVCSNRHIVISFSF